MSNVSYWLHAFESLEPTSKNQQAQGLLWNYMGLKRCKSEPLLCSSVFFWMHQTASALSDTDIQTTDCTAPVHMLPSLIASLQPQFQGLTALSVPEDVFFYFPPWDCGERFAGMLQWMQTMLGRTFRCKPSCWNTICRRTLCIATCKIPLQDIFWKKEEWTSILP